MQLFRDLGVLTFSDGVIGGAEDYLREFRQDVNRAVVDALPIRRMNESGR